MKTPYEIFSRYIPNLKQVDQQNVLCLFHDEKLESMGVNCVKGLYHCFSCGVRGDIYTLLQKMEGWSFIEAKKFVMEEEFSYRTPVLSESEVENWHKYLKDTPAAQRLIWDMKAWDIKIIDKFMLGYNRNENRVTIPIFDDKDNLINIRRYAISGEITKRNPKFLGIKGHNENYFFPIKNLLKNKGIVLMCGEPDTISATACGIVAGTFTSGEGNYNPELLPLFQDKIVYICADKDPMGLTLLKRIIPPLERVTKELKIIDLPYKY